MENYSFTKLEISVNTETLKNKKAEDLKRYFDDCINPVIFTHLTTRPKGGEFNGDVRCTADRDGVRCEGRVGFSFRF